MVNDRVFGNFPQSKKGAIEPIQWRVLDRRDGAVLLISEFVLDRLPFDSGTANNWAESGVRKWLNTEFFNTAFNEKEKSAILETEHVNNAGGNTEDKVFMLSAEEAQTYFKNDGDRQTIKTKYAMKRLWIHKAERYAYWWLRSQSVYAGGAVVVNAAGHIHDGMKIGTDVVGVRPCVWIKD
ncbi:MAG: DUF6273 domain-containing protein [Candidatus Methanoplasma sp.]|nr:DUF6273 domain-containing protein [Candidatus Methanoplasma sp.]